jgi:hypothetical protein
MNTGGTTLATGGNTGATTNTGGTTGSYKPGGTVPATTQTGTTTGTGGNSATTQGSTGATTNTSSTTSAPKQVEVPPLKSGSCPYGSYSVGSSGNACQPGTGSIICISTPGATTSTQTGFHVDENGVLTKYTNSDGTVQGTQRDTHPPYMCVLKIMQAE